MDAPVPGALGGTYAGNPLAIASALAVIDVIREENLIARGAALGDRLKATLEAVRKDVPAIGDIRGLGAMVDAEFVMPGTGTPDADFTKRVQTIALEKGLLLLTCGSYGNVIRFLFPLTINDTVMDEALEKLASAIRAA